MIRVIELSRPQARNAISRQMVQELDIELDLIHAKALQNEVRAVIVTSAHDEAFCAGADLKERKNMNMDETRDFLAKLRHTFSKLASLPIPSIACVSGMALGGGLELALCCDLRVFSGNAVAGLPETKLAVIPGAGGSYRLQQFVGRSHALDMILTGRRVNALEAARMGLCNRLVYSGEEHRKNLGIVRGLTLAYALSLAQNICEGGPLAIRAALQALSGSNEDAENVAYDSIIGTRDRVEALQAFGNKTQPQFLGI
jgi:enoyl-CoA hydratase/carnithine racemase